MTNHAVRLYAAAASLLALFLVWAAIAAHPWKSSSPDPRLAALAAREQRLQRDSILVRRIVEARYAAYRRAVASASVPAATTAPAVRIVTLPPLTITRTS